MLYSNITVFLPLCMICSAQLLHAIPCICLDDGSTARTTLSVYCVNALYCSACRHHAVSSTHTSLCLFLFCRFILSFFPHTYLHMYALNSLPLVSLLPYLFHLSLVMVSSCCIIVFHRSRTVCNSIPIIYCLKDFFMCLPYCKWHPC